MGLAWKLRHALQALQPDVVHTHLIHADLFGMMGAKLAGIRHVISSRHNDNPFRRRMALRLLASRIVGDERRGHRYF
ncbi:MAG UNVERIFIED_CONTAM: glycosyltransferase [Anaerolineae bacterium]